MCAAENQGGLLEHKEVGFPFFSRDEQLVVSQPKWNPAVNKAKTNDLRKRGRLRSIGPFRI